MGTALDLFRYATLSIAGGLCYSLGYQGQTSREALRDKIQKSFHGTAYLRRVLEVAFERSLKAISVGLKRPWLLAETAGQDFCERFGDNVMQPFAEKHDLSGRVLLDFIDAFFLDLEFTSKNAPQILAHEKLGDEDVDGALTAIFAMTEVSELEALERRAAEFLQGSLRDASGLEEEHPINRFACHKNLLLRGLLFYVHDLIRTDPRVAGTLAYIEPRTLVARNKFLSKELDSPRATPERRSEIASEMGRVRILEAVHQQIEAYLDDMGEVALDCEWLFDIADRLEEEETEVPSALAGFETVPTARLVPLIEEHLTPVLDKVEVDGIIGARDQLVSTTDELRGVLRKVRQDLRRAHWSHENYAKVTNLVGAALYAAVGPRAAERYFRESLGVGGPNAVGWWNLFKVRLESADLDGAFERFLQAITEDPDQFRLFDSERYVPTRILGAGLTGITFEAEVGGQQVAIKSSWVGDPGDDGQSGPDQNLVAHALRDVQQLAARPGRHQLRILEYGNYKGSRPYVVYEHVDGIALDELVRERGPMAPVDVAAVGLCLAEAIRDAHAAGVLHRNVRPSNVILLGDGLAEPGTPPELRLSDGGLWNIATCTPGPPHEKLQVLSVRSLIGRKISLRTLDYTAPEEVAGRWDLMSSAADMYGLGATLYRLITASSPRQPKPDLIPAVEPLRTQILTCLQRNPGNRPQTGDQLVAGLQQALAAARQAGEIAYRPALRKTSPAMKAAKAPDHAPTTTAMLDRDQVGEAQVTSAGDLTIDLAPPAHAPAGPGQARPGPQTPAAPPQKPAAVAGGFMDLQLDDGAPPAAPAKPAPMEAAAPSGFAPYRAETPQTTDPQAVDKLRYIESGSFFVRRDEGGKLLNIMDKQGGPSSAVPTEVAPLDVDDDEPDLDLPPGDFEDEDEAGDGEPEALDPLEALKLLETQFAARESAEVEPPKPAQLSAARPMTAQARRTGAGAPAAIQELRPAKPAAGGGGGRGGGGAPKKAGGGAPPAPKAPAAASKSSGGGGDDDDGSMEYGLMISGLGFGGKKKKAIGVIMEVLGCSEDEATDMVRSPVVPVLKRVTKAEAEGAHAKFREHLITARITERKVRR